MCRSICGSVRGGSRRWIRGSVRRSICGSTRDWIRGSIRDSVRRAALVFLAVCAAAAAGCVSRDHSNPFDPENPDTRGTPRILDARAGDGSADLRWSLGEVRDVAAIRIYRRTVVSTPVLLTPEPLHPMAAPFVDRAVSNGTTYFYRCDFELESGATVASAEDPCTPGKGMVWVADTDGGGLVRLTPDGRDLLGRVEEGLWFLDIAADPVAGSFWSADYLDGNLFEHAPDGRRLTRMRVAGARAVEVDPNGVSIWVASFSRGILERRARDGAVAWADSTAERVEDILAVGPGKVWTASSAGEARLYEDDRIRTAITDLQRPVALALTGDRRLIVLDAGELRLRRFDLSGFPEARSDAVLVAPTDIAGDGGDGVWVADGGRGGIVHFDRRLEEIGFVAVEGVRGVTWDGIGSRLWIAGRTGVEQRDRDGAFVAGLSLGPRPFQVAVLHPGEGN